MKKLLPYIFGVLLTAFVIGVGAAVLYYSWNALGIIFPDDLLGQSFGIMLFDIAAFIWFGALVYLARSTMQYVWSAFGFLIGLFGSLGLIAIEVGLNSEIFTRDDIAKPLTYIFIAVMFAHLILIYARHASAPEVSADISLGIEKAKITDEAMKQAEKQLEDNLPLLASSIANDLVKKVMQDLNLIPASNQVIDLPALDVRDSSSENKQGGAPNFFWNLVKGLGIDGKKYESNVPSVLPNFQAVTPKPSPVQTDAGSDEVAEEKVKS